MSKSSSVPWAVLATVVELLLRMKPLNWSVSLVHFLVNDVPRLNAEVDVLAPVTT